MFELVGSTAKSLNESPPDGFRVCQLAPLSVVTYTLLLFDATYSVPALAGPMPMAARLVVPGTAAPYCAQTGDPTVPSARTLTTLVPRKTRCDPAAGSKASGG